MSPMADDADRPRAAELVTSVLPVLVMVAVMWVEEIIDTGLDGRLDRHGIIPRELDGLDGIAFAPFLHGGFRHLVANTFPFLVLGAAICLGSVSRFAFVTVVTMAVSGVGTWLTGPEHTVHIGASGVVFGYLTYLLSRGVFARKVTYLLGGMLTFLVYGGALWGLLPSPGVSWQGHVFGAVGGVAAAWLLHARREDDDGRL
jgi:membrane associated rhomboid family serine protease